MTIALPQNLEAEQALLGALLFNNRTLSKLGDLRPEHFYEPLHARIYRMIQDSVAAGVTVDGVSIKSRLSTDPALKDIGVASFVMRLMDAAAPLSAHAVAYADLLRDLALRRLVYFKCQEAAERAIEPPPGVNGDDILLDAQRALSELSVEGGAVEESWRSAGEIALAAVAKAKAGKAKGISTGLSKLDECTGGGRPGTLWVLGGATSMGKSVGGQQFAVNVARQGFGVAYIHLEMDHDEVGLRLASSLAFEFSRMNEIGERANPYYLSASNQNLRPDQWVRMERAALETAPQLKIYVDDRPGRTVKQIESATLRLFQQMRRDGVTPGLWVVDHEGLIAPDQRYPSELEAARARGNGLKDMAKRLGVWGIALSQITKEGSRADGEERLPQSTDLNYGSALSQAAHVVILLHRKAYYAERKPHTVRTNDDISAARSRETTLIVDKARGGRRGHIDAIMDVASAVLIESGEAA